MLDEEWEAVAYFNTETTTEAMHYGAVLVNLIEKQSKEIEESEQKEKKAYIDGTDVAHELCNKYWEDKIKAKIEEFEKQQKEEPDAYLCIKVLRSLLEKE